MNTNTVTNDKLTSLEKSWIGYDIGNSAFTLLLSTILPIYFDNMTKTAGVDGDLSNAYWGYAVSISTLIVALMGPTLGAVADSSKTKGKIFFLSVLFGAAAMVAMAIPMSWISFLVVFAISRIGYQASLVFYDSMLPDITTEDRMDRVSSYGYALGYIGSCVPFIAALAVMMFYEKLNISFQMAIFIALFINALWWIGFTLPLMKRYKQPQLTETRSMNVAEVFSQLGETFKEIVGQKSLFLFILSFFFYIDGVYTIISMSVKYGNSIGLDSKQLLLALLVTQLVAFPFALLFGRLAKTFKNSTLIQICIFAYCCVVAFAVQLDKVWEFWVLAIVVGMFQGGIQALSRSYFAKLIPQEKSGEYFGLYDVFGKGAAITGPFLFGIVSQLTSDGDPNSVQVPNYGIVSILVLLIIGFILFRASVGASEAGE